MQIGEGIKTAELQDHVDSSVTSFPVQSPPAPPHAIMMTQENEHKHNDSEENDLQKHLFNTTNSNIGASSIPSGSLNKILFGDSVESSVGAVIPLHIQQQHHQQQQRNIKGAMEYSLSIDMSTVSKVSSRF